MLIVFSGVDGAGKSTQIQLTERELAARGLSPVRFWARGGYTPGFALLKALLRRIRPQAMPKAGASVERTKKLQSPMIRRVWLMIAMGDLLLCYAVWLRFMMWNGRAVLCDRYIEDTYLDFQRNFPSDRFAEWPLWKLLLAAVPRPDVRFLLLVPPEESARRSRLKNEPFPDSPETLNWRHVRYVEIARSGGWVVLDCLRPLDEIQAVIHSVLSGVGGSEAI
jgi:thymidylate kinase